jgi:O-Antigen ligase
MAARGISVMNLERASTGWLVRLAYVLFFFLLVFPGMRLFVYGKILLFALLLILIAIRGVRGFHLDARVVVWTMGLSAIGLLFGLRGLLLGTPGATQCIRVYVVWPLIYMVILSGIDDIRILRGLDRTLVFSSAFIALFGCFFALASLNILPGLSQLELLFTPEELGNGSYLTALFSEGHVELAYTGLMSAPFLVPFLMAAAVCRPSETRNGWTSKRWLSLALVLSLVIVLLSGRRALQLVTMLTPLLILGFGCFQPRKERRILRMSLGRAAVASLIVIALAIALISPIYTITFEGLAERFSAGFDFSASNQSESALVRIEQYLAMMDNWNESPLIGRGLGASAHAYIRSDTLPWAYELSYVYLLFETGVLGFAAYTTGIIWIYWSGIRIIRRGGLGAQFMLPALVGLTGMLIANATNPYLSGSDGMWAIFLPLAFINHWLLTNKSQERQQIYRSAFA